MTTSDVTLLIFDVIAWVALISIRAISPTASSLSEYELNRRVAAGDGDAKYESWRLAQLVLVGGLKNGLSAILTVAVVLLTATVVGPALGWFAALLLVLGAERLAATAWLSRRMFTFYDKREPGLLKWIETKQWLRMFRVSSEVAEYRIGSKEELAESIERLSNDVITNDEKLMLQAQLSFAQKTVASVMTPKDDIDAVSVEEAIGPLVLDGLHKTGHRCFPVYDSDLDHIVGVLDTAQLTTLKSAHETVKQAMNTQVSYIGERRSLEHALHGFLLTRTSLFIVVNDHRETVGLLSLEDVLETLLGRAIVDDFDEYTDLRLVAQNNSKNV